MFFTLTLPHVLTLTSLLFCLGLAGVVLNRKNILVILMCLEIMLLAVTLTFVAAGYFHGNLGGQVFTFFILTVAAAELAIGLAIVTLFHKNHRTIAIDSADLMKG